LRHSLESPMMMFSGGGAGMQELETFVLVTSHCLVESDRADVFRYYK
jgi:hypothetical protein